MLDMGIHAKFSYLLPKSIKFGRFFVYFCAALSAWPFGFCGAFSVTLSVWPWGSFGPFYTSSSLPISLNNIQESIVGAAVLPLRPPPRRTTCHRLSAVTCAARRSRPPQMCSSTSRTKRTYTCASSRRGRWSFEVWAPSSSKVTTA